MSDTTLGSRARTPDRYAHVAALTRDDMSDKDASDPIEKDLEDSFIPEDKDIEKRVDTVEETENDPNVVDFEGPDDPALAVNWTKSKKWFTVSIIALFTLISPLASSMFAPGVPELLEEFHAPPNLLASFVVSVYILGFAAGPLVIGPCSELYGRNIIYIIGTIFFLIFNVACALATSMNMLIGFRFLAGLAGSVPITIGGGSIADCFKQEERGAAMSIWAMGPLLGPVIGPVCGGFLSEAAGWRWVFWLIAILAGVCLILFLAFVRETYPQTLLASKTKRLRKETGNMELRSKLETGKTPSQLFKIAIVRPMKLLFLSPIVFFLSLVMALVYGYLYLVFTTITAVFEGIYGFGGGVVGLVYIGIGVGMFIGLFIFGTISDRYLKKVKARGEEMKPEHRLPLLIPGVFFLPIGLFIYGWTAQYHVQWFVPIFGSSFIGIGMIAIFMPVTTYLVDAFGIYANSAIAASTLTRSFVGAVLPLAGPKMYEQLGLGWGSSLLAFIALATTPPTIYLVKRSEWLRTNPRFQVKL